MTPRKINRLLKPVLNLDEDAGHQGGNMTGRNGVGAGQPDMQRHDAGLDAKAGQVQQKERRGHAGCELVFRQRTQGEGASAEEGISG
jgi:hypothetical protein